MEDSFRCHIYVYFHSLQCFLGVKPQGYGGWKAKGTEELALDLLQIMATQETPVSLSSQCPAPQLLFPAILLLISSFTVPGFLLVTLLTLAIAFCLSLFIPEIRLWSCKALGNNAGASVCRVVNIRPSTVNALNKYSLQGLLFYMQIYNDKYNDIQPILTSQCVPTPCI